MHTPAPQRQSINPPPTQAIYDHFHFSQATRVGDMIWLSGQIGVDTSMTPGKDVEEQSHLAFQALTKVLEASGARLSDIVDLMTFHTDLQNDMPAFAAVKDQYFPDRYPSWTAVGVSQLALPELRIEVRAVAVAGCGGS
jgi:enamine deaminase RidA (YjgF/YER057c/UK114 family)